MNYWVILKSISPRIKIGDISGDANLDGGLQSRSLGRPNVEYGPRNWYWRKGRGAGVCRDIQDIIGFQMTFRFDKGLRLTSVDPVSEYISASNFGLNHIDRGLLTMSWNASNGALSEDELMFVMIFESKTSDDLSRLIDITSDVTEAECYDAQLETMKPGLEFRNLNVDHEFIVNPVTPNPWKKSGKLEF